MKSSGIGGQAVLEGVMMRNHDKYAVAVRKPDGEISVKNWDTRSIRERNIFLRLPIIRGVVAFIESLVLGIKTLTYSSGFLEEEEERSLQQGETQVSDRREVLENVLIVTLSILLAIGFFMILPFAVSELFRGKVHSQTMLTVIEAALKMLLFLGYVVAISFLSDIKRTFMYHGAEHKTINCVENGLDLTVENVRTQSRYHRRCGTSFLLVVMIVSIIFFMFIRIDNLWLRMLYRILLIPVVAGVSFEFIQFVGNSDNPVVLFLGKPGMWLQKLTTREPDDGMIEVAIASVEAVFDWRAYQAGIRKELSRRKRHKKHREREEKKVIPEDIVQDADYEQSFAAPDPETSMELSAEDEKAFDRPQESKKAEKAFTAKKSKAEEEAKEEKTSVAKKKSSTEKAEKASTAKKSKAEEEAKEEKTSATEKKTVAKEEKVFAVSEKETEAAVREEKAVRKESRKSDRRPAKKKSIFDKLPRSKKRRELEEREARYRNRAAERMRQIKEQEEREAAHERAYQEARKRTAERIAATQELPKLQLDQDKDELKSLDRFFDDK
ncbi:putative uncharacterized protein [Roseburia sp. CAG:380]|nr:putative uncharacterized protein [Roseburia sp. CAG:380]